MRMSEITQVIFQIRAEKKASVRILKGDGQMEGGPSEMEVGQRILWSIKRERSQLGVCGDAESKKEDILRWREDKQEKDRKVSFGHVHRKSL